MRRTTCRLVSIASLLCFAFPPTYPRFGTEYLLTVFPIFVLIRTSYSDTTALLFTQEEFLCAPKGCALHKAYQRLETYKKWAVNVVYLSCAAEPPAPAVLQLRARAVILSLCVLTLPAPRPCLYPLYFLTWLSLHYVYDHAKDLGEMVANGNFRD